MTCAAARAATSAAARAAACRAAAATAHRARVHAGLTLRDLRFPGRAAEPNIEIEVAVRHGGGDAGQCRCAQHTASHLSDKAPTTDFGLAVIAFHAILPIRRVQCPGLPNTRPSELPAVNTRPDARVGTRSAACGVTRRAAGAGSARGAATSAAHPDGDWKLRDFRFCGRAAEANIEIEIAVVHGGAGRRHHGRAKHSSGDLSDETTPTDFGAAAVACHATPPDRPNSERPDCKKNSR